MMPLLHRMFPAEAIKKGRVLVACEFSGIVREAFRRRGHDAWSCDLLPSEQPGPHIQDDVLRHLDEGWDMMIAHPPCTDLCVSGARYFAAKRANGQQQKSVEFFLSLANANIPRICIENPVGIMATAWRKPDQTIQPHEFGHRESKATCLWLKNLPPLFVTGMWTLPASRHWENQTASGQNRLCPSADRWKSRSRTYPGIAEAMAAQWG